MKLSCAKPVCVGMGAGHRILLFGGGLNGFHQCGFKPCDNRVAFSGIGFHSIGELARKLGGDERLKGIPLRAMPRCYLGFGSGNQKPRLVV